MAEQVSTGGAKSFHYDKDYNPTLSTEEKTDIKKAYSQARERKRLERRRRNITIVIIILIAIALISGAIFLKS